MTETPIHTSEHLAAKEERKQKRRRQQLLLLAAAVLACLVLVIIAVMFAGDKPADPPPDNAVVPQELPSRLTEEIPQKTPADPIQQALQTLKDAVIPDWVEVDLVPVNGSGRRGVALEDITSIVVHYVGNPGTTARQNHNYFSQPNTTVSSHFLVGLEGEIIQCVPLHEKSSATNHRNRDTISIEVCHPDSSGQFTKESYDALIKLVAWLCDLCGFDSGDVIRHYDVTGKECPRHFVEDENAWTQFLADIDAALE